MEYLPNLLKMNSAPVVVMGMHRSGTSYFVKVLESLGIFMGKDLDPNNESKYFCALNSWIMSQASSTWDRPVDLSILEQDDRLQSLILQYLTDRLNGVNRVNYLGLNNSVKASGLHEQSWGWKDPRNTYTYPLWNALFPANKVIILERNGLDVANSLMTRRNKALDDSQKNKLFQQLAYATIGKRQPFGTSAHLGSVEDSAKLWLKYLLKGRELAARYPATTYTICYEEFLQNPYEHLRPLLKFLEMDENLLANEVVTKTLDQIDERRINAFKSNDIKLTELSKSIFANYKSRDDR